MADPLAVDAAVRPAHRRADWPIAAAMLQLPSTSTDGRPVTELPADEWRRMLQAVVDAGYTAIEVATNWVRVGDLAPRRLEEFAGVLRDAGLAPAAVAVPRESIVHPTRREANLAFTHRSIDAAAALGVPVVCLGVHDVLLPEQQAVQWFWTVPGTPEPEDAEARAQAVRDYRELADHAESVGLQLSLEMYEEGYLSTAEKALRFLDDIGSGAVGLNPDLGNLVRHQGPIQPWREVAAATLPRTNYWHVKNYLRLEDPSTGLVLTHPSSLEGGILDYRSLVRYALAHGFSGAFVVEHYGGDGLGMGATNERYLRSLLPA